MLNDAYLKAKSLLRPVTGHRKLLERAKYAGTKILSPQEGNDLFALSLHQPAAIGKMGGAELGGLRHYLRWADSNGYCEKWGRHASSLFRNAGVYPPEPETFSRFCRAFLETLAHLDVLGVYFNWQENAVRRRFAPRATLMAPRAVEPYYHDRPWSQKLVGKRVLVVSPFTETIKSQYRRRRLIWPARPEILPDFELSTLQVPLSACLITPQYPDWLTALEALREQMAALTFDVAIVGAGAWSIPLVTHAKSLGAWGIHLGGATQIFFGIKGKAWETHEQISGFFNEAWTRPSTSETPQGILQIENGRYW